MIASKIKLHKGQAKAWRSQARYVAMIAGTGSGKSWFGPVWLYREIQKYPQGSFLVVSPTYQMFQRIVLPRTLEFMNEVTKGEYHASDRTYYLSTGGRIYFGSADNPLSLEGVHVHAAWMDEAGQMKREAWDVVLRRVGFYNGRVLITTTPYNLGWLKTEFYDRWRAGDSNYDVIQFASIENPHYPREEFERAKATMPSWQFRMFYLGEFAKPENLIYSDFSNDNIVEPFDIPPTWRHFAGVDWGYTNPTAVVFCAQEPTSGIIYVYDEYFHSNKLYEESAMDVEKMIGDIKFEYFACDPSEPSAIQVWKQKGLPAHAAVNDVLHGINEVSRLIKSKQLRIFRVCYNTIDEMNGYMWNAEKEVPIKENDHAVDALRYAIMGLKKNRPNVRIV